MVYGTLRGYRPLHAALEAGLVAVPAAVASLPREDRRVRTLASSIGLLTSSAVLVHLSGGLIEMHFHFFVMVALVALYQDWIPFLTAIAYVLVHHGVMGTIDPRTVYNHPAAWANPWTWAGVHAFFVLGISAACLVTWRLNENFLDRQREAEELLRQETHVVESLHAVGKTLAAELDLKHVVQSVTDAGAELSGAQFGAFFYSTIDGNGESFTLFTLSGAPREAFEKFPLPRNTAIFDSTFTGEGSLRLDDVTADPRYGKNLPFNGMPPGHLPVRSYLAAPVRSRTGEVIGGLFFGHANPGVFTDIHERIITGIAAQASVAMDNARLYESEHASRLVTEAARARLALLAEVSTVTVLTTSLEADDILRGVADRLIPALGDVCVIDLLSGDRLVRVLNKTARPMVSFPEGGAIELTDAPRPFGSALASGKIRVFDSVPASVLGSGAGGESISLAVAPLKGRQGVLGCLAIGIAESSGRSFTADDVQLIEEIARRASVAVENARLYNHQRTVAETLQHSLLPERLPDVPGLQSSARYLPGGPGVDVGGDWYDVIHLTDSSVALAMGDVVGRGERAASLMGQLRNAARAFALERKSPAEIATLLNRLLIELGPDSMATMVYAIVDLDTGTMRFVNAGHPPPLIIGPDGETAVFVENGGGVPLGAVARARYKDSVTSLQPGSILVLYTDGLVEDRTTPLEIGLERLRSAAERAPEDFDNLCDYLIDKSIRQSRDDDVAILALRLVPLGNRLELHVPREPHLMSALRSTLRRWLAAMGASEQETFEIVVACGEACANAIQHAVGPSASSFELIAESGDEISIRVRDHGKWRPARKTLGGRGLDIMRRFMKTVAIETDENGTVVTMSRRLRARETEGVGL